jgi:hypothetical protein
LKSKKPSQGNNENQKIFRIEVRADETRQNQLGNRKEKIGDYERDQKVFGYSEKKFSLLHEGIN